MGLASMSMQPTPEQEIMKRSYEEHASKYFYRSAGSNEHGEWIDEALERMVDFPG